jgi:hypothetical protein
MPSATSTAAFLSFICRKRLTTRLMKLGSKVRKLLRRQGVHIPLAGPMPWTRMRQVYMVSTVPGGYSVPIEYCLVGLSSWKAILKSSK